MTILKASTITGLETFMEDGDGVEILEDLRRVWGGCIVRVLNNIWKVTSVAGYNLKPAFKITCLNSTRRKGRYVTLDHGTLEYLYPKLGYYNLPTTAIYVSRIPSRQWKLGLHRQTVNINVPFEEMITRRSGRHIGDVLYLDFELDTICKTVDIFQPTYDTYECSIDKMRSASIPSIALSRDVALALHPMNGEVHILYHTIPVGAVRSDGGIVVKVAFEWIRDTLEEVIHG